MKEKFSMKDLKPETKRALIADENYPLQKAYKLIEKNDISMIKQFITRLDITSEYLSKYVTHTNFEIRKIIALNEKLSLEDLELLLDDLIEEVVVAAIANPSITVEMLDKILSEFELISYNIFMACLKSGKVTDNQIKNIFTQYSVSATNMEENDYLVNLATEAIICKKITEDTAYYIIDFMGGSAADDNILRALVIFHPDFEKSISKFCFDGDENFFYNNACFIHCLNKTNFEYLWYCFIRDVENGAISEQQKEELCVEFAKTKHLTDQFVKDLISFINKDENFENDGFKRVLEKLVANKTLSSKSIKKLWKVCTVMFREEYNYIKMHNGIYSVFADFKIHPNTPKEILVYLR